MKGKLIVFEGVEGCGKTTQMQLCYQWLQDLNIPAIATREPGGTQLGMHLRSLLLENSTDRIISATTELLLYAADRSQHVEQELIPNLKAGKIILCDRYIDSTVAYQGYGRNLDMNLIYQLNSIATSGLKSDLTLWLDLDVEQGMARKQKSGEKADRIEQEKIEFHRRVQKGYKEQTALFPERSYRIEAGLKKEEVQKQIQQILIDKLQGWEINYE
ncbi:MAG: dTMP kinase [Rivularia sp. ALOHA_DT_140]|nr:dTMP kinase [Rivularia sp. ALOHA_DT_140]